MDFDETAYASWLSHIPDAQVEQALQAVCVLINSGSTSTALNLLAHVHNGRSDLGTANAASIKNLAINRKKRAICEAELLSRSSRSIPPRSQANILFGVAVGLLGFHLGEPVASFVLPPEGTIGESEGSRTPSGSGGSDGA